MRVGARGSGYPLEQTLCYISFGSLFGAIGALDSQSFELPVID
jgi:hypothetical protein